ncbi:MAG: hypothetical protein KGZ74_14490 [Chitinophagaceae bacterium]|nr:hypothetical protein [Chitinophagaceae bacterium]
MLFVFVLKLTVQRWFTEHLQKMDDECRKMDNFPEAITTSFQYIVTDRDFLTNGSTKKDQQRA